MLATPCSGNTAEALTVIGGEANCTRDGRADREGRGAMATFVLVHGAWSGANTFRKVRPLLREAGHEVFTPSLTGLGERSHLLAPEIGLTTHVHDVVNSILYEDLAEIVLVGYSYGGSVVTGALEYVADRVRDLVYLDAFLPTDGQSIDDMLGVSRPAFGLGVSWVVPPLPRTFENAEEKDFAQLRRGDHPIRCFIEPVSLTKPLESYEFSLTYIKATGEPRPAEGHPFWQAADRVRGDDRWRYREIATNHMIPNNRPSELAELLLELA
jgi:pimeloyl-ACP methyl ester carboxylesterase